MQEVWQHVMPKARVTERSLDKLHHLFLKIGGSAGNRAVTEEALLYMGKLGKKITP